MTDDERLAALFRAAASDADAPPPGFGHDDVLAASRRITARRRSAAVGAAAVIAFAGVGAAIVLPGSTGETASSAASAPEAARDAAGGEAELSSPYAANSDDAGSGSGESGQVAAPAPPAAAPGGSPLGPGEGACADRHDPDLRALLLEVLPEAAAAAPAPSTDVCLPGTHRYLALEAADGAARGVLTVSYLPPGTVAEVAPGALVAPTASGGTLLVGSTADGPGAAPFADRLQTVLDHLAPRL
ncbi:hypothetical protein [Pseudonocardia lacus]|uniref:hypothetical protein n=1 Tax=Pseudonocardia lacus TaxID=2835865 RepID=UPI001BDD8991|nr:hypothetical protein [Pseudonocardia lacus]